MSREWANCCLRILLAFIIAICGMEQARSHEIRPALLHIEQRENGRYDILWKQPVLGERAVRLVPHISGGVLEQPPSAIDRTAEFQLSVWRNLDLRKEGSKEPILQIEGLAQTMTSVFVSIDRLDGNTTQQILTPQNPSMMLDQPGSGFAAWSYLQLGIEHILAGIDHLAFVLGLLLLVRGRKMLIVTVTAFTAAHSLTLAAATLHWITPQPALIEALVALSILFVAVELVHRYRDQNGLTVRYPWLIAFLFGLLHGAAFAGALTSIGLPANDIPLSLLLFNLGVELGQLLFIAVVFLIGWALLRLPRQLPEWTRWIPPYAIGTCAAFWFIERLYMALS